MTDSASARDELRAAFEQHGAIAAITTNIIIVRTDSVPLHTVSSRVTFVDGHTSDIHWRSFISPIDARVCADTRNKQIRKFLRQQQK